MAASNPSISNFFEFTSKELPKVVAPVSSSSVNNYSSSDWQDEEAEAEAKQTKASRSQIGDLHYTQEHIQQEKLRIKNLNLNAEGGGAGGSQVDRRTFRGRGWHNPSREGTDGARGRGRGRGRRPMDSEKYENGEKPPSSARGHARSRDGESVSVVPRSIYGKIPDSRVADTDVYVKYDFSQRMHNTSQLVINRVRHKILGSLTNHQVLTVEGFTGCGKTTQVPQFILDEAVENNLGCRIAVTQPRRLAAISVANRVAAERKWKIGGIVGYQVGMDRRVSDDTRLTYMTTGVLLQLLIAKKSMCEWTHIIIDEVHERDLETDLLLLVIKKIMVDTYDTKTRIILMSATLDPEKFSHYFPLWKTDELCGEPDNISVDLPNQYPITELYLEDAASAAGYENFNMLGLEEPRVHQECYEIATQIIQGLEFQEDRSEGSKDGKDVTRGAVLVFLPGLLEIETLYKILTEINKVATSEGHGTHQWLVLPLHSSITNEEQQRVFVAAKKGNRKIILATNIAESSITVPDTKYVIDFCLTKNLSCDPTTNYTCLRLEWASKNQCIQRRGRCGRVSAGIVYKMVTRKFYDTLQQEACPEMLRSSLESVVLQVKLLDMGSPKAVLAVAVDPPPEDKIKRAVSNLKEIGALTIMTTEGYDAFDGCLTFVGRVLSRLPIDIRLGRLILLGHAFDCLEEAVIIAAGLSVKSPFAYPYSKRLEAFLAKLNWSSNTFSDCLALLNMYLAWHRKHARDEFVGKFSEEKAWARMYFVQLTSLREMKALIDELFKRLRICGIELQPLPLNRTGEEQLLLLKLVIAGAFYPNYFSRPRPNGKDYNKEIARELQGNDPFTSVVFQGFPMEQPGELYKRVIGKAVTYQTCIPKLSFSGSRVVVTFDSRGSFIGPISSAVYRSVKLRQLRQNVTFPTTNRDEAYSLVTLRQRQMESLQIYPCPKQVTMPALKIRKVKAIVTHFESPNEFFVVLKDYEDALKQLEGQLEEISGLRLETVSLNECHPGQFCVVSIAGTYYRARIDADKGDCEHLFVYLLDKGTSVWVRRQHAFAVNPKLFQDGILTVPALAIHCRLSEIRPSLRNGCVWSHEAMELFKTHYTKNTDEVTIEIFSIVDSVISCEIKNSAVDTKTLNQLMIEFKYADKCGESARSNENHNIRERLQNDDRGLEPFYEYQQYEEGQNVEFVPERMMESLVVKKESMCNAVLRGPSSPLEMHFNSLCYSAHLKQVITEGSSINSVVLDQDPFSPASRLMIAASVSVAHRSGNILARDTTVMPPIPGLCGLLAMLFCPTLEFRVDEDYTAYTGCVTGLGVDPSGACIYHDHDMEIVFDTQIDNEDVSMVNSIRSSLNSILSDHVSSADIRHLRGVMRNEAIRLLERERKGMDEVWPEMVHEWNAIDQSRLMNANP